ncbi:MAG: hypothetical protein ACRD2S_06770, partial [Terriglobales bacterium]
MRQLQVYSFEFRARIKSPAVRREQTSKPGTRNSKPFLLDRDLTQQFEIAEHFAGAEDHAAQG